VKVGGNEAETDLSTLLDHCRVIRNKEVRNVLLAIGNGERNISFRSQIDQG
jgi:hypothetical protein